MGSWGHGVMGSWGRASDGPLAASGHSGHTPAAARALTVGRHAPALDSAHLLAMAARAALSSRATTASPGARCAAA